MANSDDYLTRIGEDWGESNLIGLRTCLQQAYAAVGETISSPVFGTPNKSFLAGMLRFGFVDYFLSRGCTVGLLTGITPSWIKLTDGDGGVAALELRGKHTSLIAFHLQQPDDPIRDSKLRFEKRLLNQSNPLLPGFDDSEERDFSPINLTLVHGNKRGEFAFLRAYDNPENLSSCIEVSENIMQPEAVGLQPMTAAEEIVEAEITLKEHLRKNTKQQAG